MKRCPECGRDYNDDSMSFCLDDGSELLFGPASASAGDEPSTAILSGFGVPLSGGSGSEPGAVATGPRGDEGQTKPFINTTDQTAILRTGAEAEPQKNLSDSTEKRSFSARRAKPLVAAAAVVVLLVGVFAGYRYFSIGGSSAINSIAVMPFENRNSDADTDYLSDGLAESVIFRLTQIPDLRVSPTSSVMRYKGASTDVAKIATELGVDAVMTGRLTKRGDNLNITVELVDARTNKSLWGEQYERKLSELLTTQREIVAEIVSKLQLKLSGESEQKLAKKYTDNNEAYQLYLKGQFYFAKRTNDDVLRSIESYDQAIALDPKFALAYVGLANSYGIMPAYGYASSNENFPKTRAAIQRALAIDPDLAEAHAAYGKLLAEYEWNWAEAEREFKRSIELNPNVAFTHYQYGLTLLSRLGRFDEAEREFKRASDLEPLAVATQANFVGVYALARKNDMAVEQALKAFKLESGHPTARFWLGFAYLAGGRDTDAISVCESTLATDPSNQDCLQVTGYAYAKLGRRQETEAVIRKFDEIAVKQYSKAYQPAVMYALLGDKDRAFAGLERSFAARDWDISMLKVDPFVDSLRGDQRYKDLLKRMNLTE